MSERDTESHWSAHTVESRVRTMTGKGLLCTFDTKTKNLKRLKSLLLKTQGQIVSSMSDITNYEGVRTQYTQWMIKLEDFMKLTDDLSGLVHSSVEVPSVYLDLLTDFSDDVKAFQQFKETVDGWIQEREEQRQKNAKESDKCMSKSNRSSRHPSSTKSSVSAARLKEQQLRAELLTKAAVLEQKELLEMEKLKLKLKEEKFALHTEMAISDARSKVLADFEKDVSVSSCCFDVADEKEETGDKVAQPSPFMSGDVKKKILYDFLNDSQGFETQTQDVKKVVVDFLHDPNEVDDGPVQGKDRKNSSDQRGDTNDDIPTSGDSRFPGDDGHKHCPENIKTNPDNVSDILTSVVQHLSKPVPEISVFSGNPMNYHKFIRQFKTKVLNNTCDPDERMTYLEQFTSGEAKKIVSSYVCLDARKGFSAAMHDLEEKYGNENVVVNSFISKALNWPVIRADSPKALEEYAGFLNECNNAVGSSGVLNNIDNIRRIIAKIPYTYQERFRSHAQYLNDSGKSLGFQDVVYFLKREARKANDPVFGKDALNSLQPRLSPKQGQGKGKGTFSKLSLATDVQSSTKFNTEGPPKDKCLYCEGKGHSVMKCGKFGSLSYAKKWQIVMDKRLCFRSLQSGHRSKECCIDIVCSVCQGRHNSYFHMDRPPSKSQQFVPRVTSASNSCFSSDTGVGQEEMCTMVIIPVKVKMRNCSHCVETYAFLDPGSSSTFCSESLMRKLGVNGKHMKVNITSMGEPRTINTCALHGLQVFNLAMDNNVDLPNVFTVDRLPVNKAHIPTASDVSKWSHLKDLHIPEIEADIGLLIGNNVADAYSPLEVIVGTDHTPHATKTRLGWAVWNLTRPLDTCPEVQECMMNRIEVTAIQEFESLNKLDRMIRHSYNSDFPERLIDDERQYSQEDKLFMKKVEDSITLENGHYSIALPFRNSEVVFPNNYSTAHRLLQRLKKRLEGDDKFKQQYTDFMDNLFEKGYAETIPSDEEEPVDGSVWYIPHHGVFHPQKKKIRVVFNCAFVYDGVSLNQQLLSGPDLTSSLLGVLMKFKQEPYAAMGDIESMFYQVRVMKKHWNYQRFLWWPHGDCTQDPIKCRMKVHIFGATSSPSCANSALLQTAKDNESVFSPGVSDVMRNNFYVDDCLASQHSAEEAAKQVHEVTEMCSKGGFNLRKWISNSSAVLDDVPVQDRGEAAKDFNLEEIKGEQVVERALGVKWKVQDDLFGFQVKVKNKGLTRRMILSVVSSVYDPLGLGSPFVLKAKILLQEICRSGIGWDEEIAGEQLKFWQKWLTDLPRLEDLCVPRCFKPADFGTVLNCQLHVFADASELGYGVVSYIRLVNEEGNIHCSFVLSKARVTPLKKISIPRLELTAACVAVRLSLLVKKLVQYKMHQVFFWTDSMTVLRYLANEKTRFKTFVANRIAVIRDGSDIDPWKYISTKENPADPASRGMNMKEFLNYAPTWFQGPSFLANPETEWPNIEVGELPEDEPETKTVNTTQLHVPLENPFSKIVSYCSSWFKLKRFVGYYLLFCRYLKWKASDRKENKTKSTTKAKLDVEIMEKAENVILTQVQQSHFQEIYDALDKQRLSSMNKSVRKLDPIVVDGVLRVGGRLSRSSLDFEAKHPILLPKESCVTYLIVQDAHQAVGHLGKASMTSYLRQKYWILGLGYLIKNVTSKCVICRSYRAKQKEQKMADLPLDRVTCDEAPFTRVGVDFFGPFTVKRGRSNVKRYGVVFTCLASRAIHLEVASQLDTSSCVNAIRRFIARRGCCLTMVPTLLEANEK